MKNFTSILTLYWIVLYTKAAGENQQLKWVRSNYDLSHYTLVSGGQAKSRTSCIGRVSAALPDAQLVTFNPLTGACNAYKCAWGLPNCRKCRELTDAGQEVWLTDTACWTTVQHRLSASVSFDRYWADYKAGFGEGPKGNFWIGLDSFYSLTSQTPRQLLILLKLWNDSVSWALYPRFAVGPGTDNYRLSLTGFLGSEGVEDAFSTNNGLQFSTRDNDNDGSLSNCAVTYASGWWFNRCFNACLNGEYYGYPQALNCRYAYGIVWNFPFGFYYSMKEAEMLIK